MQKLKYIGVVLLVGLFLGCNISTAMAETLINEDTSSVTTGAKNDELDQSKLNQTSNFNNVSNNKLNDIKDNESIDGIGYGFVPVYTNNKLQYYKINSPVGNTINKDNINEFELGDDITTILTDILNDPQVFLNNSRNKTVRSIWNEYGFSDSLINQVIASHVSIVSVSKYAAEYLQKEITADDLKNIYFTELRPIYVDLGVDERTLAQFDGSLGSGDDSILSKSLSPFINQFGQITGITDLNMISKISVEKTKDKTMEFVNGTYGEGTIVDGELRLIDIAKIVPMDPGLPIAIVDDSFYSGENIIVDYIDDESNSVLTTEKLNGNFGDTSSYNTEKTIEYYNSQGYKLVSDDFPKGNVTFSDKEQHFYVHLSKKTSNPEEKPSVPEVKPINPEENANKTEKKPSNSEVKPSKAEKKTNNTQKLPQTGDELKFDLILSIIGLIILGGIITYFVRKNNKKK